VKKACWNSPIRKLSLSRAKPPKSHSPFYQGEGGQSQLDSLGSKFNRLIKF
jgi:hypothetical protein